nr:voltage-dependent calcium channel subunit alpha-2/delta-3-like [Parasteatoda tepidariorum]
MYFIVVSNPFLNFIKLLTFKKLITVKRSDVMFFLRIAEVAEHAAAGYQFGENVKHEYYNARMEEKEVEVENNEIDSNDVVTKRKPKKSIRDLDMKPHRNFANAPVNFKHSSVHVPTNVYDKGNVNIPHFLTEVF